MCNFFNFFNFYIIKQLTCQNIIIFINNKTDKIIRNIIIYNMFDLVPLLIFLIVVVVFVISQKKIKNNLLYTLAGVCIIMTICFIDMRERFTNYAPVNYAMGKHDGKCAKNLPEFKGPYAGRKMANNRDKEDYKLLSNTTIFSPVGEGIKLTSDPMSGKFPTVDGEDGSPRHLFMLAHNVSDPSCCPSTYSTSTGCVCTTNKQRKLINTRGGNRSCSENPDM